MRHWGLPPDAVAWTALALGLLTLLTATNEQRYTRWLLLLSRRWFLFATCGTAFALSLGYVEYYLGGGPRIVDATNYTLQARTLATGRLTFDAPGPLASFHGRFVFATPDGALASIFPPGYPLVLAPFAFFGVPMLLGPSLAAALVAATYALSRRYFDDERLARSAALLSVLCACLRYHTADTMSHGWSALLLSGALLVARSERPVRGSLLAGLLLGWLFATRPLSGLVGMGAFAWCAGWAPKRWGLAATTSAIGVLAFLAHQTVLTGSFGSLVQRAYYAAADGPPGCFDLGFGAQVGCRVEHGDFIEHYMPSGFGLLDGLRATGRRLALHSVDAGNVEVFFVVLLAAMVMGRAMPAVRRLSAVVIAQVLAYVVFYFDGNYPGGGARMFAEVLPIEHALIAWALVRSGWMRWAPPALLMGFALHTSFDHVQLSQRDGGRPMFEPELVPAGVKLLLVDTDHGFGLAHRPNAPREPIVAMHRGDALDFDLWTHLGRPTSARYLFDLDGREPPRVVPYEPVPTRVTQAESLWPPLTVDGGWAEPEHGSGTCARGGRRLRIHPITPGGSVTVTVPMWVPKPGPNSLVVSGDSAVSVVGAASARRLDGPCPRWQTTLLAAKPGPMRVQLRVSGESVIDEIEVEPGPTLAP